MENYKWVVFHACLTLIAYYGALGLCFLIGRYVFGKILKFLQLQMIIIISHLLIFFGFAYCLFTVISRIFELDITKLEESVYINQSLIVDINLGIGIFFFTLLIHDGGFMIFASEAVKCKGNILLLRRFWEKEIKKVTEEILPSVLNCYGQFTVIEIRGEYRRDEQEILFGDTHIPTLENPTVNYLIFNFTEIYLKRFSRKHFYDSNWKESLLEELKHAQFVVVDISKYSKNVLWEIKQTYKISGARNIITIAIDRAISRVSINRYNKELKNAGFPITFIPLFYPASNEDDYEYKINQFKKKLNSMALNLDSRLKLKHWLIISIFWFVFILGVYSVILIDDTMKTATGILGVIISMVIAPYCFLRGSELVPQSKKDENLEN